VPALGRDDVEVDAIEIVDTLIKDGFLRRAAPHCRSTAA
jgi:hypothetical protein